MTNDEILALLTAVKSLGGISKLSIGDLSVEFSPEPKPAKAPTDPKPQEAKPGLVNHFLSLVDRGTE